MPIIGKGIDNARGARGGLSVLPCHERNGFHEPSYQWPDPWDRPC
jgi:hypothetical protein